MRTDNDCSFPSVLFRADPWLLPFLPSEELDFRSAPPICLRIPQLHAVDVAALAPQVNRASRSARGNAEAHRDIVRSSIAIMNDNPAKLDRAVPHAQLDLPERPLSTRHLDVVMVHSTVNMRRPEQVPALSLALTGLRQHQQQHKTTNGSNSRISHAPPSESFLRSCFLAQHRKCAGLGRWKLLGVPYGN